MLGENLKDVGVIVQGIVHQKLLILGSNHEISLFEAAQSLPEDHPEESELSQLMAAFVRYPDSTKMLIQELTLLGNDLRI